ncbi:MAG TPA: PHP domain-containing protein, partial [Rhodoferax sp.]
MACSLETVVPATEPAPVPAYCELHCLSNFSFGRGASHPQELVARAAALGYAALALTDECSVAGMVRAHTEAKKLGLKLLPGAEFAVTQVEGADGAAPAAGFRLVALPHDLHAWGDLCEFITQARRAAPKGQYRLVWQDAPWALLAGCEILLALPYALHFEATHAITTRARALFGINLWLLVESLLTPDDALQSHRL